MKFNEFLKTTDSMMELLFYNTREAIACVDTQGCLVEVNQAFLDLFGYKQEEVVEKNLEQLIYRGPLDTEHHSFFRNVLAGNQGELEGICYGKQDFPIKTLIKGLPVLSGGITSASFFIFSSNGGDEQFQNLLRQREERYRFLAENMGDIIWVLDLDLNTIYVSPSVKKVLGYTPEERKKQNYREIMTPESQALILTTLQQELAREAEGNIDPDRHLMVNVEYYHKDGHTVWTENLVKGLRDEQGTLIGVYGVSRNITAKIAAELKLAESENLYRTVLETQAELICRYKPDTTLTFANKAYLDYFNITDEDIGRIKFIDLLPEEEHPKIRDYIQQLMANKRPLTYEHEVIGSDKRKRAWQRWTDHPILDESGQVIEFQAHGYDITETKEALLKLEASEARLNTLLDQTPAVIYSYSVIEGKLKLNYINENVSNVLGFKPSAFIEGIKLWYRCVHPDDLAGLANKLEGYESYDEYRFKDSEGCYHWLADQQRPVKNENGQLEVVGVWWDITERKTAEDALKQDKAFQAILLDLAAKFINVSLAEFDKTINAMLKRTGEFTGLDRAYLFRHDHQRRVTSNTHEWCREGITPEKDNLQDIPFDAFTEWWESWEKGEIVHISSVAQMPKELATRAILEQQGIQSLAVIPLFENMVITGFVGFDAVNECKSFSEQEITLLRVLAEIISNAFTRKDAEVMLGSLKAFNENIVQNITEGIIISDLEGNVTFANPALLNMLGYSTEEFLGSHWTAVVPAKYHHLVEAANARRLEDKTDRYELTFKHKNGSLLTFQVSGNPYHDHTTGELAGTVAVLTNISERKKAEEVLKASEERIRLMTRNIKDVVIETDANGYYTYVSDSGSAVLGYGQELIGQRTFDYIHPDDVEKVLISFAQVVGCNKTARVEYRFRHPKRGYIWVEGTGGTYQNNGNETMVLVTIRDITERKKTEDELRYMSLHDRLTGLFNRHFFESELRRFAGAREYPVAIVSADFDGLKLINDTLGHSAGDSYLTAGAGVFNTALRSSDILARVGGDEFALILPRTTREAGEKLVSRIRQRIKTYNQTTGGLPLSISIGLAVCENSNTSLEGTFRSADGSMYQDKFERSKNAHNAIVKFLMDSLYDRDKAAKRVTDQVQKLCVKLGQALNLNDSLMTRLEQLARVRDLGNVTLSGQLLQKSGNLTEEEFELARQHAETGYRIASSSPELAGVADLVLKHHENFDGNGYPQGLKGEEIPLECRIIAISAAYSAMINPRPYAEGQTPAEALKELKRCAGSQFDPVLVDVFVNLIE